MALMDYRSGMMSAEERGEKRADERYSRLIQILMSQKRMDDIGRIAADRYIARSSIRNSICE